MWDILISILGEGFLSGGKCSIALSLSLLIWSSAPTSHRRVLGGYEWMDIVDRKNESRGWGEIGSKGSLREKVGSEVLSV